MANPKALSQKIAQYQNDSFNVWMQKTNIATNESGDLNKLNSEILTEIQSLTPRVGTVAATSGSQTLTGTSTNFLTTSSVGDIIKITIASPSSVVEKRILSIVNNTTIYVDTPFESTFSGATYENLQSLSLVSAVNHVNDVQHMEVRRCLIRSIAMS